MTLMEAQARVDELTALRSQLAERDRQIIDLKRQINASSEDRAREWQDKCCALAAELAKLRASNDR
jgi:hypothetical protein